MAKKQVKAKDLKQAKVHKIQFDKTRPLTFDFNALCELQELGYENPYVAVAGFEQMNLKSLKDLMYASLVAGQLAEYEDVEFDLSNAKVGRILGQLINFNNAEFVKISEILGTAIADFFPEPVKKEESDEEDSEKK